MKTLFSYLESWKDIDDAQHQLGILLGMVDESLGSFQKEYKWVYWTNNPFGKMLRESLFKMVEIGMLEYNEDNETIRSVPGFDIIQDYPNKTS